MARVRSAVVKSPSSARPGRPASAPPHAPRGAMPATGGAPRAAGPAGPAPTAGAAAPAGAVSSGSAPTGQLSPAFFFWPLAAETPPQTIAASQQTGRQIVAFEEDDAGKALKMLTNRAGIKAASVVRQDDFGEDPIDAKSLETAGGVYLEELGVMVVDTDPETAPRVRSLAAMDSPIRVVEPELFVWPLQPITPQFFFWPFQNRPGGVAGNAQTAYMEGFRDAAEYLYRRVSGAAAPGMAPAQGMPAGMAGGDCFADNENYTWNLQAVGIPGCPFAGAGVRLAVLDTGISEAHPDLKARIAGSASFTGDPVADKHGHGTHCAGTTAAQQPAQGPRYSAAPAAELYVGKVLGDQGFGVDRWIFAGMAWALRNRCAVISMSLGSVAPPSRAYELAARRATKRGTLIIAAAGNESNRQRGHFAPVTRPANSPSIMAVGALDPCLQLADFSCRGTSEHGGGVDLAAPGVNIFSSWVDPGYNVISGTSMATPLVAGLACLYAEARKLRGAELWQALVTGAQRLEHSTLDVGAGLPRAPRRNSD